MYYDYNDCSPDYYEPADQYYDTEPVYENQACYDDQGFDDAPGAEGYEDFSDGFAANVPLYDEETVEEFCDEAAVEAEFKEQDHWDGTRYELQDSLECGANRERAYTPECVETLLGFGLEHATKVDMDAIAWRAVFAHGPPADSSPDTWYDDMDMWRLRIIADADAETATSAQDLVTMPESLEPPVQASWIAAKLDELQDTLQRGEIDRECYEREHDEWLEDEAEDRRLQAEGWAYDEERGDYWHSVHGWGEDYDPEESANTLSPVQDSTANAGDPPPFVDMLLPPSDFPATPDLVADIEQFSLLPISPPNSMSRPASILTLPSPPARAHPQLTSRHILSGILRPHVLCIANPIIPCPHSHRSVSAKPRDAPPHLETSQPSAARDPGEPPDTPMTKAIQAAVAHSAIANAPPPVDPVPPDIHLLSSLGTPSSIRSGTKLARSSRAPPISTVHATALPVPPDIPRTRPSVTLSSERRCNALRRLAKKGKG
ncbi:hypothetical protein K438DRAFT_1967548 [Mycena galopus ATCC 62051]|nr:hypothetical protein K438DRAFT_1967548 [Mycena galopus ATCC 62051]